MIGINLSITSRFARIRRATSLMRAQNGDVTVLIVGAWTPRLTREVNGNVVVT